MKSDKILLAEQPSVSLEKLFSLEFVNYLRFYRNSPAVCATQQIRFLGLLHYKQWSMSCGKSEVKMRITLIIFLFFIFVLLPSFTFVLAAWKEKYFVCENCYFNIPTYVAVGTVTLGLMDFKAMHVKYNVSWFRTIFISANGNKGTYNPHKHYCHIPKQYMFAQFSTRNSLTRVGQNTAR
jgi:hypothetical protein